MTPTAAGAASPLLSLCPCLSGNSYDACCARVHRSQAPAATAEQLMRSRYTAFAMGNAPYLLRSWHPSTRPSALELDPLVRWIRLDIERVVRGGLADDTGLVEFTAHSVQDGVRSRQHELSRFEKHEGVWFYLNAV